MMYIHKTLKHAAIAGGVAVFGLLFGWFLFPAILKSQLKKEMALSKKTDVRKMWETLPFALDFKIYMFNYTNPEVVQKGGIPIVKEIGPYYFENWKVKVNIEDNEEADTVSYRNMDTYYFRSDLSGRGLTGEEMIIMPHIFMIGTALTVSRDKPPMLDVIGKGLNEMFDNPPDVFLRTKVMDILFRGIKINCARSQFTPKVICTHFKHEGAKGLVLEPNDQMRFSLFGWRNNTVDSHVITVKRGIKNVMDVGTVVAINGETEQKAWKHGGPCSKFEGTDGTVFPPFLKKTDRILSYSHLLCRSFKPWFQKKTSYSGIKTNHYYTNIGDFANDPDMKCFCDAPDNCPPKGLMDLFNCTTVPVYASLPHFLDCDPKLLQGVKGLKPKDEKHGIHIDFEPISGTPMVAKQRIQINIRLFKSNKMQLFKRLSNNIVPILWFEEGLALNKTFVKMLKHQLFMPKLIVKILSWCMVLFGGLGSVFMVSYHYRDPIVTKLFAKNMKVTPVQVRTRNTNVNGGPTKTHM